MLIALDGVAFSNWPTLFAIALAFCAVVIMPALFLPAWLVTRSMGVRGLWGALASGALAYELFMWLLSLVVGNPNWVDEMWVDFVGFAVIGSVAGTVFWALSHWRLKTGKGLYETYRKARVGCGVLLDASCARSNAAWLLARR
jgi:multisubunit Na+/H+ antiporter MnhB subunit